MVKERCIMQQTIQIGQVQPSVLSQLKALVKNMRERKQAWCERMFERTSKNEFLSVIGVPMLFTPIAPLAWAAVLGLVLICGVAEWLEGGAL